MENLREEIRLLKCKSFTKLYAGATPEDQKRCRKRFAEIFGPVLLKNGFIKKGDAFYRMYGENVLHIIDVRKVREYAAAWEIGCAAKYLWGEFLSALEIEHSRGRFNSHRCREAFSMLYPSYRRTSIEEFADIVFCEETHSENVDGILCRTPHYEDGLQLTYQLLVQDVLPKLNRITDFEMLAEKERISDQYRVWTYGDLWMTADGFCYALRTRQWERALAAAQTICQDRYAELEKMRRIRDEELNSGSLEREAKITHKKEWEAEFLRLKQVGEDQVMYEKKRCDFWEHLIEKTTQQDEAWADDLLSTLWQMICEDLNRISPRILKNRLPPDVLK